MEKINRYYQLSYPLRKKRTYNDFMVTSHIAFFVPSLLALYYEHYEQLLLIWLLFPVSVLFHLSGEQNYQKLEFTVAHFVLGSSSLYQINIFYTAPLSISIFTLLLIVSIIYLYEYTTHSEENYKRFHPIIHILCALYTSFSVVYSTSILF